MPEDVRHVTHPRFAPDRPSPLAPLPQHAVTLVLTPSRKRDPMKRAKQLTKRERKALAPPRPGGNTTPQHIHCIACGRHIDAAEFEAPVSATMLRCDHGSRFPSCVECEGASKALLAEHDRSGKNVQAANAWH